MTSAAIESARGAQLSVGEVLIASPDPSVHRAVLELLAVRGIRGALARDEAELAASMAEGDWRCAVLDERLLDGRTIEQIRCEAACCELPVLCVGDGDTAERAVRALRGGADEYLPRPLDAARLALWLEPLCLASDGAGELPAVEFGDCRIVGVSGALRRVLRRARKVAPTAVPVLICGESGTGKEMIAQYLHAASRRSRGPFEQVNCAGLSESLLESELFGHERGAFTGAVAQRKGRFERAHGGTLLLDEISETNQKFQAELLRVLEGQDFQRVGGSQTLRVNVRLLSTTNRELAEEVRRGRFRMDLFYRIGGIRLEIPPLRDRAEDVEPLVWHFAERYAPESRRRIRRLDAGMLRRFREYPWPGNVRQLRNVVRSALVLGEGDTLALEDADLLDSTAVSVENPARDGRLPALELQQLEREAILEALRRTESHQAKAAKLLGITDRTLREKLRRYREEGTLQTTGESRW
jgi:DNA-binding NtrC family response regulator